MPLFIYWLASSWACEASSISSPLPLDPTSVLFVLQKRAQISTLLFRCIAWLLVKLTKILPSSFLIYCGSLLHRLFTLPPLLFSQQPGRTLKTEIWSWNYSELRSLKTCQQGPVPSCPVTPCHLICSWTSYLHLDSGTHWAPSCPLVGSCSS